MVAALFDKCWEFISLHWSILMKDVTLKLSSCTFKPTAAHWGEIMLCKQLKFLCRLWEAIKHLLEFSCLKKTQWMWGCNCFLNDMSNAS